MEEEQYIKDIEPEVTPVELVCRMIEEFGMGFTQERMQELYDGANKEGREQVLAVAQGRGIKINVKEEEEEEIV